MKLRSWLARKLDPWQARNADRYLWLQQEVQLAHRWLGEFRDADVVLEWLLKRDTDHWRALGTPSINPYPADISSFREYLRSRQPALDGHLIEQTEKSSTHSLHREAISERPGRAAVTSHPVAPNTQEE